ncbi:GrpB family protein [Oerskovia turbata]|uniref:GrpB family protein n=1 Tax=Oerskovia turbata TaxID=1713 RepID=A0A4Q1L176_9CELL|nr:GrpB family protein [Oerskovia turbata]RXR26335.1 GrpB family protein [Oerskovia turbata]RXR36510.1 GrpB family protein [Oerskovia turbata]TGJ97524.1 GrpB family protein [Actinotalea fermentans ATCC 43279 = JCM 9966 = DSM 3133]
MSPGPAALVPPDPAWGEQAVELLAVVRSAFAVLDGAQGMVYDHIGSTAVPGLAAKPFLDLQVRVPVLLPVEEWTRALGTTTFRPAQGSRPDSPGVTFDLPRGSTGRDDENLWRKSLFVSAAPAAILHIRRADSPWAAYTVALRDLLLEDSRRRGQYEDLKRRLAREHADDGDYDDYTRAKTVFFDEVQDEMEDRVRAARGASVRSEPGR